MRVQFCEPAEENRQETFAAILRHLIINASQEIKMRSKVNNRQQHHSIYSNDNVLRYLDVTFYNIFEIEMCKTFTMSQNQIKMC